MSVIASSARRIDLDPEPGPVERASAAAVAESQIVASEVGGQDMAVVRALDIPEAVDPAGHLPARGGKQRRFTGMTPKLHAQPRPLRQADDPQRGNDPAAFRQPHVQEIGRAVARRPRPRRASRRATRRA